MITIRKIDDAVEGQGRLAQGNGRFEISSSIVPPADFVISYIVTGTATQFTPLTGVVTMLQGQTRAYIDVIPTQYENNKTVSIVLTNGTGYTVGKPSVATVTMINKSQVQRNATCRAKKTLQNALDAACDTLNGYLCHAGVMLPIMVNGQPVYATQQAADQAIKEAAALTPPQVINPGVAHQIRDVVLSLAHWKLGIKPGYRNKAMEQDYNDAKQWLNDVGNGKVCLIIKDQKQSGGVSVAALNPVFTNQFFETKNCFARRY